MNDEPDKDKSPEDDAPPADPIKPKTSKDDVDAPPPKKSRTKSNEMDFSKLEDENKTLRDTVSDYEKKFKAIASTDKGRSILDDLSDFLEGK